MSVRFVTALHMIACQMGLAPFSSRQANWDGREIFGYLDGKKLLEAEDSTFLDVGKVGLWTKSDARSYFDDLTISSIVTTTSQAVEKQK